MLLVELESAEELVAVVVLLEGEIVEFDGGYVALPSV